MIDWSEAPLRATHVYQSRSDQPVIFEQHGDSLVFSFHENKWVRYKEKSKLAMSRRTAKPVEWYSIDELARLLSDREWLVLKMMHQGAIACDIAKSLSLSRKTINTFKYRLLDKMEVKSIITACLIYERALVREKNTNE